MFFIIGNKFSAPAFSGVEGLGKRTGRFRRHLGTEELGDLAAGSESVVREYIERGN